jgi:hypothetical protein
LGTDESWNKEGGQLKRNREKRWEIFMQLAINLFAVHDGFLTVSLRWTGTFTGLTSSAAK